MRVFNLTYLYYKNKCNALKIVQKYINHIFNMHFPYYARDTSYETKGG